MNKTQPTPEEITAVVSEQPDLYQPTVQPLDAVQDNGYFPIEVDAEDKELAAPSLAKLATPSSDRNWLQRFKVAAKTAVSNILNAQMTHNVALGNKKITFGKNKEEIEFGRRMASEAKRQIEEVMDGTEELTAEEAETWAAALGGGSVSMVDFAANLALLRGLGAGSVGAQLGAGWLAGRAGYEEGTMSDIDKYISETGDKELKNYKGDKKAFAVNVVSGAIQGGVEAATSGLGRYLINNPLAKKVLGKTGNDAIRKLASTAVGRTLAAGANESVNNAFEEWTQALTGNIAEIVKGNEEFSMDNILNGAGQAAGVGALLGWVATPVMQEYGRRKTRDWISDKLRKASKEKGIPLTETEIKDAANDLVGIIESKGVQKVSENYEKINQLAGAESDLAQTLTKVFEDLVNQGQIKFRQATPDEIRQAGLDWANYMQATALLDSLDREIPISAHPLFNAVAEADRIFLEGRDPNTGDLLPLDINNAQVRELANQIEDYIEQNRETRQAEEASKLVALREADMRARQETIQELERAAIAELEKEQAEKNQERIIELQQQITELQHQMDLLREERSKYIQERAAQGRISIGRAKAQTTPDNKALTKKAIRSGNLDIIKQILHDNGFKTRDLSGTQTKQMAQLNWEMFAGKDLGTTKSKYDQNVAMKAIQQNVVSGDAVLLRAGYTQGQIDQMDDKTWNRALQAAYQEETEALKSVQPQLTPEQAAQIPDDLQYQDTPFDLAAENARLDDMYPAYTGETINIDGKERTVYNSNGERIAQSEPALRNFWNWFGDSKVVDEDGRPLVVYHGTPSGNFDAFYEDSYFTADKEYADSYQHPSTSATWTGKKATAPKTFAVYLRINNPFTTTKKTAKDIFEKEYTASYAPVLAEDGNVDWTEAQDLIPFIKEQHPEYDGILLSEGGERGVSYVPFEPNQIKSTENTGEFGIGVNNMYHQDQIVKKVGEDRTNADKWLAKQDITMKIAKDFFGTTETIEEAGYILPDGSMLDFSGANFGGSVRGKRMLDHRDIRDAFEEFIGTKEFPDGVGMEDFINAGAIRFQPENITFMLAHSPTKAQLETIDEILENNARQVRLFQHDPTFEIMTDANDWGTSSAQEFSKSFDVSVRSETIKRIAAAFYKGEGVLPEMLMHYQPGYVSLPVPEMIGGKLDKSDKLVVSHGISLNSINKALALGGLPSPSIAISKATDPLTDFGTIKLVGTKEMIDPENEQNLVYDRDIWSATFPRPVYKNATKTASDKFRDKFRKAFIKADEEFVGAIVPPDASYDEVAANLVGRGLVVIRTDDIKGGVEAIEQIKQGTVFQNKKTSKSTTGLGTEHRGGYDPMTKAIIFNKTSDLTTLFHESAHYWFDRNLRYYRTGLASPEWKKKWEDVMNELGATPNARGTIPVSAIRSASEKFARSMEAYLREGKYESAAIQWAHQDYANMVKRVYRNIWATYWGLDDLSPAVKQWFDMFGLKTDDATTAFAEEDKIETDEQMVGAVIAEDATKPDVDAETKAIVADAGAQVVENPATQEIAVVPADPFETGKKARSKLPRSAEAATGVSMDDIIYNRRSMSDAFKAAQQLVNTDPVRAWEILKGGQEMVDGLYAGDIYRALIAKYQAENNPTMLKNVVQAFAGAARRAGRSVKAFDLESPRISFEKTINSLDKIFDTKKNDKRIEKVKNELKEFLHDPSALRVGWEEFKNIVGCK